MKKQHNLEVKLTDLTAEKPKTNYTINTISTNPCAEIPLNNSILLQLAFCDTCLQMTNHRNNICQKCKHASNIVLDSIQQDIDHESAQDERKANKTRAREIFDKYFKIEVGDEIGMSRLMAKQCAIIYCNGRIDELLFIGNPTTQYMNRIQQWVKIREQLIQL